MDSFAQKPYDEESTLLVYAPPCLHCVNQSPLTEKDASALNLTTRAVKIDVSNSYYQFNSPDTTTTSWTRVADTIFLCSFMAIELFSNITFFAPLPMIPASLQSRILWAFAGLLFSFIWAFYLLLTVPASALGSIRSLFEHRRGKAFLCVVIFLGLGLTGRAVLGTVITSDMAVEWGLQLEEMICMISMVAALTVWW